MSNFPKPPWIKIQGYPSPNLFKTGCGILFKGFEGEYPMDLSIGLVSIGS
jgi:hypothetical protein